MTNDQQVALEALAGRSLTEGEIAAIEQHLPLRNDPAIAEILSVGRTQPRSIQVGVGTILAVMKPRGGEFLDAVSTLGETDREVYWGMDPIKRGVFDPSLPPARVFLTELKAKIPGYEMELDEIAALGMTSSPLRVDDVSAALNKAEKRMVL